MHYMACGSYLSKAIFKKALVIIFGLWKKEKNSSTLCAKFLKIKVGQYITYMLWFQKILNNVTNIYYRV